MKLVRWGFTIHGGVDVFSRLIVYLACNEDNRAITVSRLFLDACATFGVPSRVRADYGGENNEVKRIITDQRGQVRSSMLRGSSIHNQRIERLWRYVFACVARFFYRLFYFLERHGVLHFDCAADLYALHFVFLPRIRKSLYQFVEAWNHHNIRSARGRSPNQLFVAGQLAHFNDGHMPMAYPPVDDPSLLVLVSDYGIDWEGPQPAENAEVECPQIAFAQLSTEHFKNLQENIDPQSDDSNYKVDCYIAARTFA